MLAGDLLLAVWELARARAAFARLDLRALASETAGALPRGIPGPDVVNRVSYLIPRVAHRLPWRADCMIQAMAAKAWLKRYGIETSIAIGIDRQVAEGFEAHAWLEYAGGTITGGETGRFTVIFGPNSGNH